MAVIAVAMLWTAWSVVARTAAQSMAASDPSAALGWYSGESLALDNLASDELSTTGGDVEDGRNWAERSFRANPLDSRALFLLGLAAEKKGQPDRAATLIQMAGARSWRDTAAQAWLFDRAVRRAEYARALAHLDAMLRLEPDERWLPLLAAFTLTPESFKALADFLATSPPWREWCLARLSHQLQETAKVRQLYDELKHSVAPPTPRELIPYVERLIADGDYRRAHEVWLETQPAGQRKADELLFNADFEQPLNGIPFNWQLTPVKGADIRVAAQEGSKTRALRLQLSGARVNFSNVKHLLMLPAGSYRFSGRQKADELQTSRGLWWRIFCADNPKTVLGQTELLTQRTPWRDFELAFRVPEKGCRAQMLQVELPARIGSEQQIEGDVWYDRLRITAERADDQRSELR